MSNFDPQAIRQGNLIKAEAKENPATFATDTGVVRIKSSDQLERNNKNRMAGEMGSRALELMNPEAAAAAEQWMNMFGQSNEGEMFNQAKMRQAMTAQAAQSRGAS